MNCASLVLALGLLLSGLGSSVALAADPALLRLEVTIGKSQVLNLQEPFTRVSVTNPAIADVFVVTPNQILINGKAVGTTSLVVFYPSRTVFFDVLVAALIAGIYTNRLQDAFDSVDTTHLTELKE